MLSTARWVSPDDVAAEDLPLAKAAEKVLASMHVVLRKTAAVVEKEMASGERSGIGDDEFTRNLRRTKAAEIRVVQSLEDLKRPVDVERFKATAVNAQDADNDDVMTM